MGTEGQGVRGVGRIVAVSAVALMVLLGAAFGIGVGSGAARGEAERSQEIPEAAATVRWQDGVRVRTAWREARLVAELPPFEAHFREILAKLGVKANPLVVRPGGVRLWALAEPVAFDVLERRLALLGWGGRIAPVFRDGPERGAPKRVPLGDVIVLLPAHWTKEQMRAWCVREGLEYERALPGSGACVVRASGPEAALELAERLGKRPEVRAAVPDWWQELATR